MKKLQSKKKIKKLKTKNAKLKQENKLLKEHRTFDQMAIRDLKSDKR